MTAPRFQSGGSLQEGALYVERAADALLPAALRDGALCYVLAPRQIGKSSLRVRTARKLTADGARCATLDLTRLGGRHSTPEAWYFALVQELSTRLRLPEDPAAFWRRHGQTTVAHRLALFLREALLSDPASRWVLFVDEVDSVLALPFCADDFFAVLRDAYNARAEDPAYLRLTFCLLGVAAPADLIDDEARTPFNVGRRVRLSDFTAAEAASLLAGLTPRLGRDAQAALARVLRWTDGHPYMTQRLCEALVEADGDATDAGGGIEGAVDGLVERLFLRRGRVDDANLEYAQRRLLRDRQAGALLRLYERLLDEPAGLHLRDEDPVHAALLLTGMATDRDGTLRARNLIFTSVFDRAWVKARQAERVLSEPLSRWLAAGRTDDLVLRGQALEAAQAWAATRGDLTPDESAYLLAGVARAREEERERARLERAEAEAAAQRQSVRRLRWLLALTLALLGFASLQYRRATRAELAQREAREETEAATLAERGARAALLSQQPAQGVAALRASLAAIGRSLERGRPPQDLALEGLSASLLLVQGSRALRPPLQTLRQLQFSPDGALVLGLDSDTRIRTWDARSGAQLAAGPAHGFATAASFSPRDGALALGDRRGRVWLPAAGLTLEGHLRHIWGLRHAADGARLVSASMDGTARIWEVATGRTLAVLRGHEDGVRWADFSPDGERVISAGTDGTVRLFEARTGRQIQVLRGHRDEVVHASFSGDGALAISGSFDRTARIWDLARGTARTTLSGHDRALTFAAFLPGGGRAVTAARDGTARLWDTETGTALAVLRAHADAIRGAALSGDGRRLVTGGQDLSARVWELQPAEPPLLLLSHTAALRAAAFTPDGAAVISVDTEGRLRRFTARTWTEADPGAAPPLPPLTWGRGLGLELPPLPSDRPLTLDEALTGVPSGDGQRLLTRHEGGRVGAVWAGAGRALLCRLRVPTKIAGVAFSGDGEVLIQESDAVTLWDGDTCAKRGQLFALYEQGERVGPGPMTAAAYFPPRRSAGPRLITAHEDGGARIWGAAGGAPLRVLSGHEGALSCAQPAPDGRTVITCGRDGTARLWDAVDGRPLRALRAHLSRVNQAVFSPDGRLVATAGDDHSARVWDIATGALRVVVKGHTGPVVSVAFSPDGRLLISAGEDRAVLVHPASVGQLVERACALLRQQDELAEVAPLCAGSSRFMP